MQYLRFVLIPIFIASFSVVVLGNPKERWLHLSDDHWVSTGGDVAPLPAASEHVPAPKPSFNKDRGCKVIGASKSEACLADRQALCAEKTGRELFGCISENIEKVSEECKNDVQKSCNRLANLREKLPMAPDFCRDDVKALCGNIIDQARSENSLREGFKGIRQCLLENVDKISNEKCKAMVGHAQEIRDKIRNFREQRGTASTPVEAPAQ